MSAKIRIGGVLSSWTRFSIMVGGSLKFAQTVKMKIGGSLQTVFTGYATLTVSLSPNYAIGFASGPGSMPVTTNSVTGIPSGGVGPYTYAWTISDVLGNPVTVNSPSSAASTFTQTNFNSEGSCDCRCTVTDSLGNTAYAVVTASFQHFSGF